MKRQERAALIMERLQQHYPETPVPLDHSDPFTLLVAVLLSAQCTDKKVNEVTPALFAAGQDPAAMAALSEETILGHIRQLGLARTKARNVKRLAELLLERHGGMVPRSFEQLEDLPGVGHKTASVVMAQAFGVPAFPVDTHIHRLAQRWGLSSGKSVVQTEHDLKTLFPKEAWNRLHLQIIFYGREFCTAR
ncbi:MAG: endonuclease III, partial [Prochlorococcaceae cyanobacterium MAG_34]|nr:endonuclease III [Cyanobium sp. MAG_185]MDP4946757.1 endonuclease III [Cyanobium sp. MAG_102]MDP5118359.1 endonuclease III [Prochlorococcaceae cyanobacterium MAG_34]